MMISTFEQKCFRFLIASQGRKEAEAAVLKAKKIYDLRRELYYLTSDEEDQVLMEQANEQWCWELEVLEEATNMLDKALNNLS